MANWSTCAGPATLRADEGRAIPNVKEDIMMATKFGLYRAAFAVLSLAAMLEAIGAPRKFN